jgi:hypothetical protein
MGPVGPVIYPQILFLARRTPQWWRLGRARRPALFFIDFDQGGGEARNHADLMFRLFDHGNLSGVMGLLAKGWKSR